MSCYQQTKMVDTLIQYANCLAECNQTHSAQLHQQTQSTQLISTNEKLIRCGRPSTTSCSSFSTNCNLLDLCTECGTCCDDCTTNCCTVLMLPCFILVLEPDDVRIWFSRPVSLHLFSVTAILCCYSSLGGQLYPIIPINSVFCLSTNIRIYTKLIVCCYSLYLTTCKYTAAWIE